MTTDDIKQFAAGHFTVEEPTRIEWIDDTSANIIYSSPEIGLQALSAFTQVSEEEDASALPALRLRSAKQLPSHPDSVLQVRSAVKTDRKKPMSRRPFFPSSNNGTEGCFRRMLRDGPCKSRTGPRKPIKSDECVAC